MGGGQSKESVAPATGSVKAAEATTMNVVQEEACVKSETKKSEESKCPMHRGDGTYSFDWKQLFGAAKAHGPAGSKPLSEEQQNAAKKNGPPPPSPQQHSSEGGGCPVKHRSQPASTDGCPVMHDSSNKQQEHHPEYNVYSQPIDKTNQMPKGVRTQLPVATQTSVLSTDRVSSSIPKGGGDGSSSSTWTYPSPQQFYNALARKGKLDNDTSEDDMESVVALHNNMNEKTWGRVVEWERQTYSGDESPKLLKFQGRPSDLSPKAMFKHYVLGHPLPYDRHDWTIVRGDGTTVRYIIDYYFDETRAQESPESAKPTKDQADATPSLLVDVRPALDGPSQFFARAVQMPYKHATSTTTFEYLPLRATSELASQVKESVKVWQSIQQAVDESKARGSNSSPSVSMEAGEDTMAAMKISESQAQEIATNFAKVLKNCQSQQQKMGTCESEEEFSKASMDLTLCLGPVLCNVQHASLVKTLQTDDDDKIEASLETLNECLMYQNALRKLAKEQHPGVFGK